MSLLLSHNPFCPFTRETKKTIWECFKQTLFLLFFCSLLYDLRVAFVFTHKATLFSSINLHITQCSLVFFLTISWGMETILLVSEIRILSILPLSTSVAQSCKPLCTLSISVCKYSYIHSTIARSQTSVLSKLKKLKKERSWTQRLSFETLLVGGCVTVESNGCQVVNGSILLLFVVFLMGTTKCMSPLLVNNLFLVQPIDAIYTEMCHRIYADGIIDSEQSP